MTSVISLKFGYYPRALTIQSGPISIGTLPDLDDTVREVQAHEGVDRDWIYSPPQLTRNFTTGVISERPYPSRIFGMPKTHWIAHASASNDEHLNFLVWVLSFFTGMRLTSTEAGFVDATPIQPGKLVDFMLSRHGIDRSLMLAEEFWINNRANPERHRLFSAATHALFLSQNPKNFEFERFILLYTALDACFALAATLYKSPPRLGYARRVEWMCGLFGVSVPVWASSNTAGGSQAAIIRNAAIHEALFMDEPLGFALHDTDIGLDLPLEMGALICRLLVALLGASNTDYVRSAVNTRQIHGLSLP